MFVCALLYGRRKLVSSTHSLECLCPIECCYFKSISHVFFTATLQPIDRILSYLVDSAKPFHAYFLRGIFGDFRNFARAILPSPTDFLVVLEVGSIMMR